MKYSCSFTLIIGALLLIEVKCDDSIVFRVEDPENYVEGQNYERFNFFTESIVDDKNVNNKSNTSSTDQESNSSIPELLDSICLDEVSSDVENNYVLTGVRLHRLNNTLMIQIQQAKIWRSRIIRCTLHWIPLPEKCNNIARITASKRTLILDDSILPGWTAATGVAFRRASDLSNYWHPSEHQDSAEVLKKDPFFLLMIGHGLGYNYLQTYMRVEAWVWNFSLENRTDLINDDMDVPTALMPPLHNQVLSIPKKNYVTLALTKSKQDLHKHVIPYVDTQNVTDPRNNQFVRGIGLYYKGYEGYGGYIALSLFVPEYDECSNNIFLNALRNASRK